MQNDLFPYEDVKKMIYSTSEDFANNAFQNSRFFHIARNVSLLWIKWTKKTLAETISHSGGKNHSFDALTCVGKIAVAEAVAAARREGRQIICVLSPMFTSQNLDDGFFQRVRMVDNCFDSTALRLYLTIKHIDGIIVTCYDDMHYEIACSDTLPMEDEIWLIRLGDATDLIYQHSIYNTLQPLLKTKTRYIIDLHGAVPEELIMMGDKRKAEQLQPIQQLVLNRANMVVCVSQAMRRYVQRQAGDKDTAILPCSELNILDKNYSAEDAGKIRAVYTGGVQKWQNISLLHSVIEATSSFADWTIYTPSPNEFFKGWKRGKKISNLVVKSASHEEVMAALPSFDYGFLLRDEHVVNEVSCPTKLVEYLCAGVIPVLKSAKIGDFKDLGMQYVSVLDFAEGNIPNFIRAENIKENNKLILKKLSQQRVIAINEILKIDRRDE